MRGGLFVVLDSIAWAQQEHQGIAKGHQSRNSKRYRLHLISDSVQSKAALVVTVAILVAVIRPSECDMGTLEGAELRVSWTFRMSRRGRFACLGEGNRRAHDAAFIVMDARGVWAGRSSKEKSFHILRSARVPGRTHA